ncbi:MAG: HD domain-containing phosphohydrolase [Pyrinomonadaceae bacterium]
MLPARDARACILIADDDQDIREVLYELLSDDYDCWVVASAEDVLARLSTMRFDVVVSDINMEGMNGLEMIPHVLTLAPDTTVIMVSGAQTVESAIEALRAGAFDYVTKPFDLRHVEAAVKRALEHKRLCETKRRYENYLEELIAQRTAELDHTLQSLEDSYRMTLKALAAALETRDHETHGHSERAVSFSLRLGRELQLSDEQMRALEFGSLLHDIGKIGVPDAILHKPAKLDDEEWVSMRQHPVHGQQILQSIEFLGGAARVVGQHHEKWDGTGYPLGLRGAEIDLNARIFAVADAFDAITSDRVYRTGRSYEVAAAELNEYAGQQFDPEVVAAFRRIPCEEWDELRELSFRQWREQQAEDGQPAKLPASAKLESLSVSLVN